MALRSFAEVLASVAHVDGWMTDDQARRLFDAARSARPGDQIVEIGSFRGRSTIVLASAAPDGVRVVAIDPHAGNDRGPQEIEGFAAEAADDHEIFLANLTAAGVDGRVLHIRDFSDAAHRHVHGPVAVLYIDGAHRYRPARADIATWGARVGDGGTMLVHDSFSAVGVTLAILRELVFGRLGGRFRYVGRSRSLAVYVADRSSDGRTRLVDALRQLAALPWFTKNVTVKVMLKVRLGSLLRRLVGREVEWPY